MENNEINSLGQENIPNQLTGSEVDAVETEMMDTLLEASAFYAIVKGRLLAVNNWYEIADLPAASFSLYDHLGQEVNRAALEGDYIRIDIPGPGPTEGEGYDWVRIEKISEVSGADQELLTMQVRPAAHPSQPAESPAHFLDDSATATFQVKRLGLFIQVEHRGRNEVANTNTSSVTDNIRNTLVGWTAKLGLSYPQWKTLVSGLISRK